MSTIPSPKDYDVLVMWPPGTRGESHERRLVSALHALAVEYGLGRLHQMVEGMEDLWRHPERRPAYEAVKARMVKDLSGCLPPVGKVAPV